MYKRQILLQIKVMFLHYPICYKSEVFINRNVIGIMGFQRNPVSYTHLDVYKRQVLYTPPVTPWESVTPEVSDRTERTELPKAGRMTGVKS